MTDSGKYHRREILSIGASSLCSGLLASDTQAQDPFDPSRPTFDGKILMCGGGKLPDSLLDRFCEISNAQKSTLVLIPTASERADSGDYSPWLELWKARGWQDVQVLHAMNKQDAQGYEFGHQIQQAAAVWITGGDQSRLSERFCGTVLVERLVQFLRRGGVLGGTSAGAAILSKHMIAAGVDEPMMGQGFGLLPGTIIDQHFTQKNRFARLSRAVTMHPNLLGIGIDESTGIQWSASKATVLGTGQVHGYVAKGPVVRWSQDQSIDPKLWPGLFDLGWVNPKQANTK
ncbi:MAG: cyanophycinase [Planctomycetota bacterium]|jgi:cyanophycinase